MRYWPLPSLTTVRNRSISAALVASTVTSATAAPDASCTVPAIACANAVPGTPAASARRIANVRRAGTIIPRRVKPQPGTMPLHGDRARHVRAAAQDHADRLHELGRRIVLQNESSRARVERVARHDGIPVIGQQ